MNRLAAAAMLAACLSVPALAREDKPACPDLAGAQRLMLVTAPSPGSVTARVQLYRRYGSRWRVSARAMPAVVGKNGLAWAWNHSQYAQSEPPKAEGDKRSPAGFFTLGKPFGFSSGPEGYVRLEPGVQYCVDDPASPHYNTILPKAKAGAVSGEDMGLESLYRQGLFVDYPTSASQKGGSCIFVHTWRSRTSGTAGCVALAEDNVRALQRWAAAGRTAIAILPQTTWKSLRSCFPGI